MISYKPLMHTLIERDMDKTDLVYNGIVASHTLAKLSKNEHINTSTLEKICKYLKCRVEDVIEVVDDLDS